MDGRIDDLYFDTLFRVIYTKDQANLLIFTIFFFEHPHIMRRNTIRSYRSSREQCQL